MDPKNIIIIGLVLLIIGLGSYYYFQEPEVIKISPEKEALIFTSFNEWASELGNPNGYIFSYWIYNFGEIEAKNVVVECIIIDEDENIIKRINKTVGNLASGSMEYNEMYTDIFENTDEFSGYCLTKSCSNCNVLEKNIIDLNKYLE